MSGLLKKLLVASAVLLLIPLIAGLFTKEVNWSGFDFLVAGILFTLVSLSIDAIVKRFRNVVYRRIMLATLALVFILLWAEMAVGLFGSPIAGN